ncbi:MAG TPA: hypothetical protein VFO30_07770 [Chthoniobacterales bacterium]|nr:hypothetical protein [Chthoniobacterales bacterium]
MKPCALFIALAFALAAGGCADPLERRSTEEVGSQMQRGITGQGQLIPSQSVNNPTGAPSAAETPPDYPSPR